MDAEVGEEVPRIVQIPTPTIAQEDLPALLVAYTQLHLFDKFRGRYHFRDWVMDSGAFSAFNSGAEIKLKDYIDCCKRRKEDNKLSEIYALDVIGDWKSSLKNTEEMWRQGVEAIPCYHFNEPWDVLVGLARDYPKIALGGVAQLRSPDKVRAWVSQCFARIWPKKVHGFAFGTEKGLMAHPWHSVDATNWELRPRKFGIYDSFGRGSRIPVRGGTRNLRPEILRYLDMEKRARIRWQKQMVELGCGGQAPTIRFASADGMCLALSGYATNNGQS